MTGQEDAMDFVASPLGTSGESFWSGSGSTGLTTPALSPLSGPSKGDDLALSPLLSSPGSAYISFQGPAAWDAVRNICVVGAGYVGGPTAAVLALNNPAITVNVLDQDPRRIQKWTSPHLPVHEPGLVNVVRTTRDSTAIETNDPITNTTGTLKRRPNLFFTCDSTRVSQADMIFLAVNTPTKTFGEGAGRATNMTAIDKAVREIAAHAKPGTIIVEKSTVPCGTAQRVRQLLASLRPGIPFEVLSNPEFLAEGSAIDNLTTPDRVLIGSSGTPSGHHAARVLASVYSAWVPSTRILKINSWSSELAKLVANAMLAQRISSINSISAICERTGAEVDQVSQAIGLDPRIGPQFLKAGLGFGGSCFRKDIASLTYLAETLGLEDVADYWRQVNVMNEAQRNRFAGKVVQRFRGNLVGQKLALLGFAFKKGTGDPRESLAVDVIRLLLEERPLEIAVFDPFCRGEDILWEVGVVCGDASAVRVYGDPYLACSRANALLVITDCDQFRSSPRRSSTKSYTSEMENSLGSDPTVQDVWVSNGATYHLTPQDACPTDCADCRSQSSRPTVLEPLEWARIAYNMKDPKWVFDGRGVLDMKEMEMLGVRVDAIGRRSDFL